MDYKKLLIFGIPLLFVLVFVWSWYRHSAMLTTQPTVAKNSKLELLTQIKKDPSLSLLHGKLIVMSADASAEPPASAVYNGMAYILAQSQDDINASSTSVLVDPSKISPITDLHFFEKITGKSQGALTNQQIDEAHLVLAYYNVNGWLLIKDINNMQFNGLVYDVQNNTVVLKSRDPIQGKSLYGQLEEYSK